MECDTFMPPIDEKKFRLWAATAPRCVFQLVCASSLCSLCDNPPLQGWRGAPHGCGARKGDFVGICRQRGRMLRQDKDLLPLLPLDGNDRKQFPATWPHPMPCRRADDGVRYSFLVYTRPGESGAPSLPPAVAARHEEMQASGDQIPLGSRALG